MSSSPIRDGFRTTWRSPGLLFAEIGWRWSAGGALCALLILSFYEYAATLKVSGLNWMLWNIGYPPAAVQAFADTVARSGHKLLMIAAIVIPGMAVVWTVAASLGRTATLRDLMPGRSVSLRTILGISFFRSALLFAALIGFAGVFAVAMRLYSDRPGTLPHPARATWILVIGWVAVAYFWSVANWFLSIAPVVAVEENCDAVAASIASVRVFGEKLGPFIRVNLVFGTFHLLVFLVFAAFSFLPMLFAAVVSFKLLLVLSALMALVYFALVDFLYVARLGAYVNLVAKTST